jgi:hypothetical protein
MHQGIGCVVSYQGACVVTYRGCPGENRSRVRVLPRYKRFLVFFKDSSMLLFDTSRDQLLVLICRPSRAELGLKDWAIMPI